MCLTAFEFILLYVLIIGLWINNWFFFQAITVVPKHSVCITTSLNYKGYKTAFCIQCRFEWTEICSCPSAGNSRFQSSHTMSNIPFFGMSSLIYPLEQSVEWLLLTRQAKSWGQKLSGHEAGGCCTLCSAECNIRQDKKAGRWVSIALLPLQSSSQEATPGSGLYLKS